MQSSPGSTHWAKEQTCPAPQHCVVQASSIGQHASSMHSPSGHSSAVHASPVPVLVLVPELPASPSVVVGPLSAPLLLGFVRVTSVAVPVGPTDAS